MGKILMTLWPSYSYIHGNVLPPGYTPARDAAAGPAGHDGHPFGEHFENGTLERGLPASTCRRSSSTARGPDAHARHDRNRRADTRREGRGHPGGRTLPRGSSGAASSARSSTTSSARSRSDVVWTTRRTRASTPTSTRCPSGSRTICRQVRDLVHAADPEVTETIKRTRQPYFVLDGNICALLAAKDHVNVFLYDGAIVPDPEGIITAGHDNKTARTVAFRKGEPINARRSWRCSSRSSPTTAPAAGASSSSRPEATIWHERLAGPGVRRPRVRSLRRATEARLDCTRCNQGRQRSPDSPDAVGPFAPFSCIRRTRPTR